MTTATRGEELDYIDSRARLILLAAILGLIAIAVGSTTWYMASWIPPDARSKMILFQEYFSLGACAVCLGFCLRAVGYAVGAKRIAKGMTGRCSKTPTQVDREVLLAGRVGLGLTSVYLLATGGVWYNPWASLPLMIPVLGSILRLPAGKILKLSQTAIIAILFTLVVDGVVTAMGYSRLTFGFIQDMMWARVVIGVGLFLPAALGLYSAWFLSRMPCPAAHRHDDDSLLHEKDNCTLYRGNDEMRQFVDAPSRQLRKGRMPITLPEQE